MSAEALAVNSPYAPAGKEPVLVSVLMLAYNHGPYIRESILSVLAQRGPFRLELLIGEDCSTDETRRVVEELSAAFPEVIRAFISEKNLGMHENGRRLEAAARGKYVAYCEGDDYWHDPDKLARQVAFLEENPDYVMVHSDFRLLDTRSGRLIPSFLGPQSGSDDANAYAEIIAGTRIVLTLTVCLRKSALEVALREPECYDNRFLMGDTQRWLEVSRLGKVRYFPAAMATQRALAESATRSRNAARVLRFAKSAWHVLEHYIAKYPPPRDAVNAARRRSAMAVLRDACAAGDREEASRAWVVLEALGEGVPLEAKLHYLGSRSPLHRRAVVPLLFVLRLGEAFMRRLRRLANGLAREPAVPASR